MGYVFSVGNSCSGSIGEKDKGPNGSINFGLFREIFVYFPCF